MSKNLITRTRNPITDETLQDYINFKITQKNHNSYSPDNNNIKYLVIFACHCNSEIKLSTIKRNLKYFDFASVDVLLLMTTNLPYNSEIEQYCSTFKNIKYVEVPNNPLYDFGKWIQGFSIVNYNNYDFTILTNDSYVIYAPINHFFNLTYKYNVELYGYNDSTQRRYHYQSYLIALKKDAIPIFIHNYDIKKDLILDQQDVITHYEIAMTDWFTKIHCFLEIGNIESHKNQNIFHTNPDLYDKLKKTTLLPFTKIHSLTQK
jgi:hypothetical protein